MKKFIFAGIMAIIAITIVCLGILKFIESDPIDQEEINIAEEKITSYMNGMTLEEKIGQMFIISGRTPTMTDELRNTLNIVKPGGFIFFQENFTNYENTMSLINEINKTAKIPYIMSIDQEGGRVQRLRKSEDINVETIPPMAEIGLSNDLNLAYETGKKIGFDLKTYGLNMNFAPVMDTLTNKENKSILGRSFGSDYNLVANMGVALAKGLNETGVISVYKHFPGLGSTTVDSHYDLPVIFKNKEELLNSDLIPFKKAIENNAEVIMIGHLAIPNITGDETPSSLSKTIVTNLLKEELGYKGLVITDALNMKALTNYYTEKEKYEEAILAGVDLLLMPEHPEEAITWIKESITSGTITEERINDSVKKILLLKHKYFNFLQD